MRSLYPFHLTLDPVLQAKVVHIFYATHALTYRKQGIYLIR